MSYPGVPEPAPATETADTAPEKPKTSKRQTATGCGCLTLLVVVIVVVLVNVFSGGSSNNGPQKLSNGAPAATPTTTAAAAAGRSENQQVLQAAFVALVKAQGILPGKSDNDIVATGAAVCAQRESGESMAQVLLDDVQSGDFRNPVDGGRFVGAAVAAFCPQYTPEIDAIASQPTG
jgi:hypothetical protein